ncbi:MAG: SH3 domain-containing protein [Byssovorax sp.]
MESPAPRCLSRLAPVLGALVLLSAAGCIAAPADESFEAEDANQDGLTGSLPVGTTLSTTTGLNLRSGPSTSSSVLTVIPTGAEVSLIDADPVSGFYHVSYQSLTGWSSGKYLTGPAQSTPVASGKAWKFRAKTLAVDIAVFLPEAADAASDVDVLVYAHGLNVCSPVAKTPPLSFVTDAPFNLAKVVDATKRPVVLVVPFFDWEHLSANGMAFGGSHHKLGIPANLNGVVAEVLAQVGQHRTAGAPGISSLILAGHSRAYDFLNPLAAASADPQMATGALARLTQVWGLDTGYVCSPIQTWSTWMKSNPELEVTMDYRAGTQTASCGQQFAAMVPASGGRLSVHVAKEEHCAVPGTELPGLLDALP